MTRTLMYSILTWLAVPLLLAQISSPLFAQEVNTTLKGKIVEAKSNTPLSGATIHIIGSTNTVTSNNKGEFEIKTFKNFPLVLSFSFVGYEPREIPVTSTDLISVSLKELPAQLGDVVVVGYGTQRRKDITGSVSSVPKENLTLVTPSVDNLIQGAVAGVQVTQSSGQPGSSSSIRIRGGNSITGGNEPLYVIDGFPVYNDNSNASTGAGSGAGLNALATINPSDIESIDILKDASATAIYGSRGANGVVLITTKKGTRGSNNVSYQGSYGTQKIGKTLSVLNGREWALLRNDIINSLAPSPTNPPVFTPEQIDGFGKGTDWQNAGFRTAPVQNHELSFSGGDDKSRYAISGNYFAQDGILINTDFKRYSARVNYENNISALFKVAVNVFTSHSESNGAGANTAASALSNPNAITSLLIAPPVVALKNADGTYNVNNPYATLPSNPILDLLQTVNQTLVNRSLGNLAGEYKLFKGLTARVSIGADLINSKQNYFAPANTLNGYNSQGIASVGTKNVTTWLNENTLNYDKKINENNVLNALVGYTTQYSKGETVLAGSSKFVTDATTYNSLQSGTQITRPSSDAYDWTLNSFLARVNYTFLRKYNFTLSGRADGSSRFGSGNKWGYFPSAGFSWNVNEEKFLSSSKTISNLKLRLSAGSTGNQEIGQYLSLAVLDPINYNLNRTGVTGFSAKRLSNPDLRWEKTAQYDAGVDIGFLANRFNVVVDYYHKKTTDLLLNVPIPLTSGFTTSLQNIGSVENNGFEIGVNSENIAKGPLKWKTSVVYALNKSKVLGLGNNRQSFLADIPSGVLGILQPVIVKVGEPLGTFWGYQTNGIFQTSDNISSLPTIDPANTKAGDRRYVDQNGDGKITTDDKVLLGSAQPKFSGSVTNVFAYGNFDLLIFFQGSYGNKIYNALKQQLEQTTLGTNTTSDFNERWTTANPGNTIPRAANSPVSQMSGRYVEDGSYLRLKNISLGYRLPVSIASKIRAKNIKVYIAAQNLITWTKYTGYDPEVNSFEQNNVAPGIDYGAYPNYKTFLAGLNVTF